MARKNQAVLTIETLVTAIAAVALAVSGIIVALCRLIGVLPEILKIIINVFKEIITGIHGAWKEQKEHEEYVAQHYLDQAREEVLARKIEERKQKILSELKRLLAGTENKLYYNVEKTEFPSEGRIREYVNFFTYDRQTVAVENANALVNEALNNVLGVYKGKSKKLHGTIVLEDYACDMKDISRNLADKLGVDEIKMVIA